MRARAVPIVGGIAICAFAWEILARTHALGSSWPTLGAVGAYLFDPAHRTLLTGAARTTAVEALEGLGLGSIAALAVAALGTLIPAASGGLGVLASIVNGVPVIAVAGICALTLPRGATPIVVAALATGFIVFVAVSAAFSSTVPAHRDLFIVFGASRTTAFVRLDLPGAVPGILDGLRSAAPAAVVGAIIGEWFAAETGLGPLLVASMQNYAIDELWAVAALGTALSMAMYGILGLIRGLVSERLA